MRIIVFLIPPGHHIMMQIKLLFSLMISVHRCGGKQASKNRAFQRQTKRIALNTNEKQP